MCFYLFHSGAETRQALLDYARAVYTGALTGTDGAILQHFGVSADELGRRAHQYAKDVLEGSVKAPGE